MSLNAIDIKLHKIPRLELYVLSKSRQESKLMFLLRTVKDGKMQKAWPEASSRRPLFRLPCTFFRALTQEKRDCASLFLHMTGRDAIVAFTWAGGQLISRGFHRSGSVPDARSGEVVRQRSGAVSESLPRSLDYLAPAKALKHRLQQLHWWSTDHRLNILDSNRTKYRHLEFSEEKKNLRKEPSAWIWKLGWKYFVCSSCALTKVSGP